ncbi:flagellar hook-associated protein FlgL [uncultured Paraglaciecola sp.]|uniref:flagellar hook-associated protein FlgL n=1 Tax=uncultured Paraglaciecola sp. TaxID=1765024 RepID=UPI0030D6CE8F|tara:strand:+ start:13558 stop:14781 length:1224 start_codon:yes stop_codon:yes gene_type:complete
MRISTGQLYDRSIQSVLNNQAELSDIQQQLSSGKKLLRPSDDPVGSAQVIRLTEEIDLITQYKKNSNLLTNSLEQEETVLSSVNNAIDRARVLMVQSGNGIMSADDKNAIAIEIAQIRDQVFDLMNSRNPSGEYIFAGFQSASPAFSFNASSPGNLYNFEGDGGQNEIQVSDTVSLKMNNSGQEVFENVYSRLKTSITGSVGATSASLEIQGQSAFDKFHSNNYDAITPANNEFQVTIISPTQAEITNVGTGAVLDTVDFASGSTLLYQGLEFNISGTTGDTVNFQLEQPEKKNIAETLNDFVEALTNENISNSDFDEALADALTGVDNSKTSIGNAISQIGGRRNSADSVLSSNLDLEIANKTARSNIEEVDYAEAVSELSRQETALQAAQATFTRVTGTSLFDYI